MLDGRTVLVTGVTGDHGFIGGRLAERLASSPNVKVRVLVNSAEDVARVAGLAVERIQGSFTNPQVVNRAVAGCDIVFHCAHDVENARVDIEGARVLSEACLQHATGRLVHLSSLSVNYPLPDGILDESVPPAPSGWKNADSKVSVESVLQQGARAGLPLVVVQPTVVYGPSSGIWTDLPVRQMRKGWIVLPDDGSGLCNAVYIDDMVNGMVLAAANEQAAGERFLISGDAPVTWREFYAAYERMLGIEGVALMPTEEIGRLRQTDRLPAKVALLRRDPYQVLHWRPVRTLYNTLRPRFKEGFWRQTRQVLPARWVIPDAMTLSLYRSRTYVSIEKARRVLGYEPQFSFEQGMALTAEYVKQKGL